VAVGWAGNQVMDIATGHSVNFPPADYKASCKFTNTAGVDLIITTLYAVWFYPVGTQGGMHQKGIVYSDNAGVPDALLHVTDEITFINNSAVAMPFSTPWTWTAGTTLWLGVIADSGAASTQFICPSLTGGILYNSNSYASGPSNPYGTPSVADFVYVIWAEGYDGSNKLGRISIGGFTGGNYLKLDAHYERFQLGGVPSAPMGVAASVSVSQIQVYITATLGGVNSHCAIYADDGGGSGTPGTATLLGVSNALSAFVANTWHVYTFSSPIVLAAGHYWLAFITDLSGGTTNVTNWNGELSSAAAAQTDASFYTWRNPITITDPFLSDQRPFGISIYADYTLTVGPDQFVFPQIPMMPRSRRSVVPY
jgi:hypothetical protein